MRERSGFLQKQGYFNKAFKRRHFILKGTQLAYYKKQGDAQWAGVVTLDRTWKVITRFYTNHPYSFELVPPDVAQRSFVLCADTYEDRVNWIEDIEANIQELRDLGTVVDNVVVHDQYVEAPTTTTVQSSPRQIPASSPKASPSPSPSSAPAAPVLDSPQSEDQNESERIADDEVVVIANDPVVVEVPMNHACAPHAQHSDSPTGGYFQLNDDNEEEKAKMKSIENGILAVLCFKILFVFFACVIILALAIVVHQAVLISALVLLIFVCLWKFRGTIRVHWLCRGLDQLGKRHESGVKSLEQCKAEAVELFETHVGYLQNDNVLQLFFKFVRFTQDGTKWSFIRRETGFGQVLGKYGSTNTFKQIIRMLQDRAITNYHAEFGEGVPISRIQEEEKLKPLLTFNVHRLPLSSLLDDRTFEL
eukprot:c9630_g1_i1.p1 GENE.c9630_g1_i1~~c9630_g1_i1.p1  ORF type:complete len:420 (+),score=81.12 c9630_g1_i1:39-1298(+)